MIPVSSIRQLIGKDDELIAEERQRDSYTLLFTA